MKITFYSNFFNHHQLPFCEELYKRIGKKFTFVATESIPVERLNLGYEDLNKKYSYILTTYDSLENQKKANDLAIESDVIILGSASEDYIKKRMNYNKLTFRYSERIYKNGIWRIISPRGLKNMIQNHSMYKKKNMYLMCASAYAAGDFFLVRAYNKKTFKWGYFPHFVEYKTDELQAKKNKNKFKLLWCGRFISWKHPEKAVEIAKILKEKGYDFELNFIGTGVLENTLKELILKYGLGEYVKILGSKSPIEVRKNMLEANIFLFTSDYNEGWGAVLNEAMNSGCAVVASHAIGAVPFMIKDGVNGLVYKDSSIDELYQCVEKIMNDRILGENLGNEAYKTVKEEWNAKIAVNNFLAFIDSKLSNREVYIEQGPMSEAKPIMQWRMFKEIKNTKGYKK